MDRLIRGLEDSTGSYIIDDLVIFNKMWEEHIRHLRALT
jgi:hypothetical protein